MAMDSPDRQSEATVPDSGDISPSDSSLDAPDSSQVYEYLSSGANSTP